MCQICQKDSADLTTTCSHSFHKSCFDNEKTCPLCFPKAKNDLVEQGDSKNGMSPFLAACKRGDLDLVRHFVEQIGNDINECWKDGITGLMLAAIDGNFQLVSYLLDNRAEIDRVTDMKWTALMFAAMAGKTDCVGLLIARGANVTLINVAGESALTLACIAGSHECVSILIKSGADINIIDNFNWSPIQIAARNKDIFSLKHLIEGGADINICTDTQELEYFCPLSVAIMSEDLEIFDLLLQSGAKLSTPNKVGITILHVACMKNCIWSTRILIREGVRINDQDLQGTTPLMICAEKGHIILTKLLLEHGADPNIKDLDGATALLRVIRSYISSADAEHRQFFHLVITRMLFSEYNADPDIADRSGETARNLMAKLNDPSFFKIL